MKIARTITMLALAREALEKFDNNVDAAISYLSQRLRDDSELREALVKSAVEYESLEELHS
jgi:SOS response regulatory protein OraA/RecX